MRSEQVATFVYRHRRVLFGVWLIHAFLLHYFVLGYMTGDGLAYRVTPVIELLQHGQMAAWKYPTDWSLDGHVPFVELAHLPFLAVLGLRGLLVGFPLVLFPLCVVMVFRFVRELTNDQCAATFGTFAYVAMPMVNAQAFGGLIDFVVVALLAHWLHAVLRLRNCRRPRRVYVQIAIATLLLSVSRQHALYIVIALLPFVLYALFMRRERMRITVEHRGVVVRSCLAVLVGAVPAVMLQVYRTCAFGSPLAPSELRLFGIQLADGVPLATHLRANGIGGDDAASLAQGFFDGWIWHLEWPMGAFYHSQWFAAGFITIFALATLHVWFRTSTRAERWILGGLVLVSLLARDFALPRWSYTLTIALVIVVGRSMSALVTARRGRPLFFVGCAILTVQLFRPELDLAQIETGHWISPRLNVSASPWFPHSPGVLHPYPDRGFHLVIVERTRTGYTTQLFGRRLTNEVVGTVREHELGDRCEGRRSTLEHVPDAVFVDELDLTKHCTRTCAIAGRVSCKVVRIALPAPSNYLR